MRIVCGVKFSDMDLALFNGSKHFQGPLTGPESLGHVILVIFLARMSVAFPVRVRGESASGYAYQRRCHGAQALKVSQRRGGPASSQTRRPMQGVAERVIFLHREKSHIEAGQMTMLAFGLAEPSFRIGRTALSWGEAWRAKPAVAFWAVSDSLPDVHKRMHARTHERSLVRQGRWSCTATRPDLCKYMSAGVDVVRVLRTGTASDGAGALDIHVSGSHPGGGQAGLIRLQGGAATRRCDDDCCRWQC